MAEWKPELWYTQLVTDQINFRWLGIAGTEIKFQGTTLLTDPFLTRPSWTNLLFGKVTPDKKAVSRYISKCNYVLVTHSHFDHIMDVPNVVKNTGAIVSGSPNSCQILSLAGVPQSNYQIINAEDSLDMGSFKVKVLLGHHPSIPGFTPAKVSPKLKFPCSLRDYKMDNFYSFLISAGNKKLLIWNNSDLEKVPRADIIFLVPEKDKFYYKKLFQKVQPKNIIPIHWDNFFLPLSLAVQPGPGWQKKLDQFSTDIKESYPRGKVLIPEIFSIYNF